MPVSDPTLIAQTDHWIKSVVIGCNFCPFAAKAVHRGALRYVVIRENALEICLERVVQELQFLDRSEEIETTLLIFPEHFSDFEAYLELAELAENLSVMQGYEGIYQIATFHPEYCFAEADPNDPANYTNRSPYPMLHLLREESISNAVEHFPDPEGIPGRNVAYAKARGWQQMKLLRDACFQITA